HKLKALQPPHRDMTWSVYAYVLNQDIVQKDGEVDDFYGALIPLGSFERQEMAEQHASQIIELTGHPTLLLTQYGRPAPLRMKPRPGTVKTVSVEEGKLRQMESARYQAERR